MPTVPPEVRGWVFIVQSALLVALATLNLQISWVIYGGKHRFLAIPNATIAVALLVIVSLTWWNSFRGGMP